MLNRSRPLVLLLMAMGWNMPVGAQQPGKTPLADALDGAVPAAEQFNPKQALHQYYTQQVGHEEGNSVRATPDPNGPQRMQAPTPVEGFGLDGAPKIAHNNDPYPETIGPRLDTTWSVLAETSMGTYFSEHQFVAQGGATILPLQTPCYLVGLRAMGNYADQMSMIDNPDYSFTLDLFFASRYKESYFKLGSFWDNQDPYGKFGLEFSVLQVKPILGPFTVDAAFGWGMGSPTVTGPIVNLRPRLVECELFEVQVRAGRFWTQNLQAGVTYHYYDFQFSNSENEFGAFANIYMGRTTLGLDVTGGDEGLRGFVTLGFTWGCHPCDRARDCAFGGIDTIGWLGRATNRDPSVRLRESQNGPLPVGP